MYKGSEAYTLAEHIHSSFFGTDATLSVSDVHNSRVRSAVGSSSSKTSERIEVTDTLEGARVHQTLAKDKFGTYHLSTTSSEPGAVHLQTDIRPNTSFAAVELLAGTIFMHKLVAIAHDQH